MTGPYPQPRCSLCEHMHGLPVGSGCYVDGCVCYTPPLVWKRHRNEGQTWCRRSGAGVAGQDYIDGVSEPFCPICGRQAPTQPADRAGDQS